MPRRHTTSSRWLKSTLWSVAILAVLLTGGALAGQAWLNRYLKSPEFRRLVEEKSGIGLRAQVTVEPLHLNGNQFTIAGVKASGGSDAAFTAMQAEDITGEVHLPSFLKLIFGNRTVRLENVEMQRFTHEFYNTERPDLGLPPYEPGSDRPEVGTIRIRDYRLAWSGGGIVGADVRVEQIEGGWKIEGTGGRLTQIMAPALDLVSARLVYKDHTLFVQEGKLRRGNGEMTVSGEANPRERGDLLIKARGIDARELLPENWYRRLRGDLGGEVRVQFNISDVKNPRISANGPLRVENGVLEALPILDKIATFLNTERFRRIELTQCSADVTYDATGLRIANLQLESKQLIALRGNMTIVNGQVDGTFDLGITPGPLQWLPGAQERVFTNLRDGYAWAPVRITGPLDAVREDLSPRLTAAATGAVVDKVQNTATEAAGTAVEATKKAATGVFDLLFGN